VEKRAMAATVKVGRALPEKETAKSQVATMFPGYYSDCGRDAGGIWSPDTFRRHVMVFPHATRPGAERETEEEGTH
jgi:hypothetical protein